MKILRKCLSGLAIVVAAICLYSVSIGAINLLGGAPVYGSQRLVVSFVLCALLSLLAFLLWLHEVAKCSTLKIEFNAMPDSKSRAEFVAMTAASKLRISAAERELLLTEDLSFSPIEVMNLWDELAEDFGIELSADDYPDLNSISALENHLSNRQYATRK